MLDQVAFGAMPRGGHIAPDERRALVGELIDLLFPDAERAEAARRTFGLASPPPVHRLDGVLHGVQAERGVGGPPLVPWELAESAIHQDVARLTPGYGATVAVEAVAACTKAGRTGAALAPCVDEALAHAEMVKSALAR
jgi:hypothetical protein